MRKKPSKKKKSQKSKLTQKKKIKTEYKQAIEISAERFTREQEIDIDYISRMSKRTDKIVNPEVIVLSDTLKPPPVFKIATISLDLKEDDLEKLDPIKSYETEYQLYSIKPEFSNKFEKSLMNNIREACKLGAHFICANELAFSLYPKKRNYKSKRKKLDEELLSLANENKTYIIPGTYHCIRTLNNYALLYYPGKSKYSNPKRHAKRTSATSAGEVIRIPYNRDIRLYKTNYADIGILICLDSYDPSMVIRMIRILHDTRMGIFPHIIFVPSFNDDVGRARKACKDTSYFLTNIVVLSNTISFGGNSEAVYLCGEPIRKIPINNELNIYNISYGKFKNKKATLDGKRSQLYKLLFGVGKKRVLSIG